MSNLTEETFVPHDTGSYPSDTVPEETTVHTLSTLEVDELVREITNSKKAEK